MKQNIRFLLPSTGLIDAAYICTTTLLPTATGIGLVSNCNDV